MPAVQASWAQDLAFAGDLTGHMTAIVTDTATQKSACTGARPRQGQIWSDEFYGTIDTSGATWGVYIVIQNYAGPGTYHGAAVAIEVASIDALKQWQNGPSDAVTFTLDRSGESGTIDAMLTNNDSAKAAALHVSGRWNCKA